MVKHIAFTVYPVTDMTRARAFYEGDLGLKRSPDPSSDFEGKWVEYALADSCFALTTMMEGLSPPARAGGKIAFEVDDVDELVETLRKKGISVIIEPKSTPVCRLAMVSDPEGNGVFLHKLND
jgi:predicted enzyme related to lactoylglutathione lyase